VSATENNGVTMDINGSTRQQYNADYQYISKSSGANQRIYYIQFDLPYEMKDLVGVNTGATVQSASLFLTFAFSTGYTYGDNRGLQVGRVGMAWDNTTDEATLNASIVWESVADSTRAPDTSGSNNQLIEFDITNIVQDWVDGEGEYGIAMRWGNLTANSGTMYIYGPANRSTFTTIHRPWIDIEIQSDVRPFYATSWTESSPNAIRTNASTTPYTPTGVAAYGTDAVEWVGLAQFDLNDTLSSNVVSATYFEFTEKTDGVDYDTANESELEILAVTTDWDQGDASWRYRDTSASTYWGSGTNEWDDEEATITTQIALVEPTYSAGDASDQVSAQHSVSVSAAISEGLIDGTYSGIAIRRSDTAKSANNETAAASLMSIGFRSETVNGNVVYGERMMFILDHSPTGQNKGQMGTRLGLGKDDRRGVITDQE